MAKPRSKDYDLRASIVDSLLADGVPREAIRNEITLDTSSANGRLDLLILRHDRLTTIEIKSGSDRLDRLKDQKAAALRATDHFTLVCDIRHHEKADSYGTTWWHPKSHSFVSMSYCVGGWIDVQPRFMMPRHRASEETSVVAMARMLWKEEACAVVQRLAETTCPPRTRHDALIWIKENARLRDLRPLVCEQLWGRPASRWDDAFWQRYDAERV